MHADAGMRQRGNGSLDCDIVATLPWRHTCCSRRPHGLAWRLIIALISMMGIMVAPGGPRARARGGNIKQQRARAFFAWGEWPREVGEDMRPLPS